MDSAIRQLLEAAVAETPDSPRSFSGAVVTASDASGTFHFATSAGTTSAAGSQPVNNDSVFWIASLTKLTTAIAAMQLVEQGYFSIDSNDDVVRLLPELVNLDLITSFDPTDQTFTIGKASRAPTLKELLTHTSGFAYDALNPQLFAWRVSRGEGPKWMELDVVDSSSHPLISEPGTAWHYGPSLDWVGKMVERQTGLSLGEYLRQNVFRPLGIKDATFHLEDRPDLKQREVSVCSRANEQGTLQDKAHPISWTSTAPGGDDRGGIGLYSTGPEYLKILLSLINNDGVLLKNETLDQLFQDRCNAKMKADIHAKQMDHDGDAFFPGIPSDANLSYCFAGALFDDDYEDLAKKGSVNWNGLPHCAWLIDREAGYCAVIMCSYTPTGHPDILKLMRNVYRELAVGFAALHGQ